MMSRHCFKVRSLILATTLIAGLGLVTPVTAQEWERSFLIDLNSRTATPLGTLGRGQSEALGINDAGQVVGSTRVPENPYTYASHAFITGPDGMGMRDLGTLGGGLSEAHGINDAGQVVGGYFPSEYSSYSAFITGPDGMGMRDLGTLGIGLREAHGINDAGQVVGYSDIVEGSYHAFITGPDGTGMRDLGTLGGGYSNAWDINDAGQVVGASYTAGDDYYLGDDYHAFITGPDGTGMRDLGALGGNKSEAHGINDAGQVVGWSWTTVLGDIHAFVTGPDGEGMMDLNSLVDLPEGTFLTEGVDINNNGQVIAVGVIPEPQTYALMLVGLGLVGFMARRRRQVS